MDNIFPDITAFSPWLYPPEQLDKILANQYKELKTLYKNTHEYNIDLSMSIYNLIIRRRMSILCNKKDHEIYKSRNVEITFNPKLNLFNVIAKDNEPVLKGYPSEELKRHKWFASYDDDDDKTKAIVCAPLHEENKLNLLFSDPAEYVKSFS